MRRGAATAAHMVGQTAMLWRRRSRFRSCWLASDNFSASLVCASSSHFWAKSAIRVRSESSDIWLPISRHMAAIRRYSEGLCRTVSFPAVTENRPDMFCSHPGRTRDGAHFDRAIEPKSPAPLGFDYCGSQGCTPAGEPTTTMGTHDSYQPREFGTTRQFSSRI